MGIVLYVNPEKLQVLTETENLQQNSEERKLLPTLLECQSETRMRDCDRATVPVLFSS